MPQEPSRAWRIASAAIARDVYETTLPYELDPRFDAARKVFKVTELLENILSHMPCRDLLLSQRVQRHWMNTILGSPELRQALFLEPIHPHILVEGYGASASQASTFRDTHGNLLARPTHKANFRWSTTKTSTIAYTLVENPLLSKIFPLLPEEPHHLPMSKALPQRIVNSPNASWKRMLLSQPPVKTLHQLLKSLHTRANHRDDLHAIARVLLPENDLGNLQHDSTTLRIHNPLGLTMGDLVQKCRMTQRDERSPVARLFLRDIQTWLRADAISVTAVEVRGMGRQYDWQEEYAEMEEKERSERMMVGLKKMMLMGGGGGAYQGKGKGKGGMK